jgi:hypothetical protein
MPNWGTSKWFALCLAIMLLAGGWALWMGR